MEKWEMTFKQYCENWLTNCKYRAAYEQNQIKWENKKKDLLPLWKQELINRAEVGPIPSDVLMSFIRQFSEKALFSVFRGVCEPGVSNFRIPASVRAIR